MPGQTAFGSSQLVQSLRDGRAGPQRGDPLGQVEVDDEVPRLVDPALQPRESTAAIPWVGGGDGVEGVLDGDAREGVGAGLDEGVRATLDEGLGVRHRTAAVEVVGLPDVPQVRVARRVSEAEALDLEPIDEAVDDERRVVRGEAGPAAAEGGAELLVEVQGLDALVVVVEDGHLGPTSLERSQQGAHPAQGLGWVGEGCWRRGARGQVLGWPVAGERGQRHRQYSSARLPRRGRSSPRSGRRGAVRTRWTASIAATGATIDSPLAEARAQPFGTARAVTRLIWRAVSGSPSWTSRSAVTSCMSAAAAGPVRSGVAGHVEHHEALGLETLAAGLEEGAMADDLGTRRAPGGGSCRSRTVTSAMTRAG